MDDNVGSKFDMIGTEALANKDNARKLRKYNFSC